MRPIGRRWRCPDCAVIIRQMPGDPLPNFCVGCGADLREPETDEPFVPQAPRIRNAERVKAVDDVYYGMEDASKARAEMMAEMTPGASASDFKHTIITDMNDRQRPGDIAYKAPPPNPVTKQMEFLSQRRDVRFPVGNSPLGNGIPNYQPDIPQGGLGAIRDIQLSHFDNMARLVSAGRLNQK